MSQTENSEANSDERIRKIYAKDLKRGETVHTVFRAARKEKHTSRSGKAFLALTLVDRTGEVDGRVFENVEAADGAFGVDDYLLLKGKVGEFHGKTQIVVDRLERLDPGPIDEKEFAFTPAPPPAAKEHREAATPTAPEAAPKVHLSKRLARLLENPKVASALDVLVAHLEKAIEEKVHAQAGLPAPEKRERPERPERKPKGPRVEHRHKPAEGEQPGRSEPKAEHKAEPRRDPSLPEGLAFKPFNALVNEPAPAVEPKPESDNG